MIATIWMILHLVHPSRLLALKKPPAEHFYHHRSSFCRLKNKQRLFGITSNSSSWFIRRPGVHCCLQRGRVCAREVDRRSPSLWEAVTDLSVMFRRNMMMLVPLLTSLIMTKLFTWKTSLPIDVIMLKCLGPGVLVTTWAQSGENVRPNHNEPFPRLIPPDPNMLNLLGCFSPHPSQSLQPPKTAKILLVIGPWIFGIKNSIWSLMIGILHLLTCWLPDPPGAGSQRPTDQQCKNQLLRLARVFPALQVIKLVPLVVVDGDRDYNHYNTCWWRTCSWWWWCFAWPASRPNWTSRTYTLYWNILFQIQIGMGWFLIQHWHGKELVNMAEKNAFLVSNYFQKEIFWDRIKEL